MEDRAEKLKRQANANLKTAAELALQFREEMCLTDSIPLYFKDPSEPLELFTSLEEQNLFLIQNAHENEAVLEQMQRRLVETRQATDQKLDGLEEIVKQLQGQVERQRQACGELKDTLSKQKLETISSSIFQQLHSKISHVHAACGLEKDGIADASRMLEQIEARIDEQLMTLARYTEEFPDAVHRLEKLKEKERRERVRLEKVAQQHMRSDERLLVSLKRTQEVVEHRVGRPVMFRSPPIRRKEDKKQATQEDSQAALDYEIFFS